MDQHSFKIEGSGAGRRAAVVGGSLGGLTAAAVLLEAGWDVQVYERSIAPLDGAGAGIVAHPATLRYLIEYQGLSAESLTCSTEVIRTLNPDGSVLFEQPSPYLYTSWTVIYRQLVASLGPERHHLGHEMVGLDQDEERVRLTFNSGQVVEAELVVCADGIASTARRLLGDPRETLYSGYVGWRGLVQFSEVDPGVFATLSEAITFGLADHTHIVAYPIPVTGNIDERVLNYVWYRNVDAGTEFEDLMTGTDGVTKPFSQQQVRAVHLEAMRADAARLAPPLAHLVQRTARPFLQAIVDLDPGQMAHGRIAILGDAASVARPHAAAGTAKAAEDAWTLGAALADEPHDIGAALKTWEQGQLELASALVARSRRIGECAQVHQTWSPSDPAIAFGLYGPGR